MAFRGFRESGVFACLLCGVLLRTPEAEVGPLAAV